MSSFGFMDLDFVEEMVSSTGTSHFSIIWPTDEQALSRRGKGCLVLSDTNVNFLVNANAGAVRGDRSSLRMQRVRKASMVMVIIWPVRRPRMRGEVLVLDG